MSLLQGFFTPFSPAPAPRYGEHVPGLQHEGRLLTGGVFDENRVRAAAGLTLALGTVALVNAWFAQFYLPIQIVTVFFFIDFALRVAYGLRASPVGIVAGWLTRRTPPHWVSARPKRFAWSIGIVMALAMALITNIGIRGALPLSICLLCLALMWMEAVLGICLGCEIHAWLLRRGWIVKDREVVEICAHDACAVTTPR
jgi:hypothetical protein